MSSIILSALWGVVMMFSGIFLKKKSLAKYIALVGIIGLLTVNFLEYYNIWYIYADIGQMLKFTPFGQIFNATAFACTLLFFILNAREFEAIGPDVYEYYALIFFVLCGVCIAVSFNTLLMLFLGIEIITIPLYILAGSDKRNLKSNEASLKYFLMGVFSTGIMLMGIAFLYGATGTFYIEAMNLGIAGLQPMMVIGIVLLMVAMSFKVSAAPFHFWVPDVYDGAPTAVTSFMATIVKVASFMAFLHLFDNAFGKIHAEWQLLIALLTAATLFIGNITAVFQQSVKRMLAYSSVAHAGFMLFALFGLNTFAREGLILYTAAYSLATIGSFAVLAKMKDFSLEGFNGLGKTQPLLALTNTVFLLSLTGIPLTAGFFAKYYMLMGAVKSGNHLWLVIFAVLMAAISAYYYFRVIQSMYFKDGNAQITPVSPAFKITLCITAALIILLGMFPHLLLKGLYY
ncbi:NADH-quinone oxidoreductase subunit N [Agriterribacter sp.]|uniref:NADH-quinone oxidoreductase subunit N n=1 Tax=Agriterribacter sp. TaxID=2821509 RepID=UPI002C384A35|nr:NADH-quinone oxidoreductase subunit N [Agriterribacter sp.]HTN06715.1 NADH-quinone oxidoreductase subunit N [Agriterribacter sp.]